MVEGMLVGVGVPFIIIIVIIIMNFFTLRVGVAKNGFYVFL